jgi:hypothetical protein
VGLRGFSRLFLTFSFLQKAELSEGAEMLLHFEHKVGFFFFVKRKKCFEPRFVGFFLPLHSEGGLEPTFSSLKMC